MSETIPERYGNLIRLKLVEETEATKAVEPWRRNPGAGLFVLSGGVGSGKTLAACVWVGAGLFVTAARLSRWNRYDNAEMNRLLRNDRLVIDDLGTEYMDDKGNFMAVLDEVIADRYANERPTLITTNLDVSAFRTRYGERIADRIRDNGKFVAISANSRRHAQTAEEKTRLELARAEAKKETKSLCEFHLYGAAADNEHKCTSNCPEYGRAKWPIRGLVTVLAESKS